MIFFQITTTALRIYQNKQHSKDFSEEYNLQKQIFDQALNILFQLSVAVFHYDLQYQATALCANYWDNLNTLSKISSNKNVQESIGKCECWNMKQIPLRNRIITVLACRPPLCVDPDWLRFLLEIISCKLQ